MEITPLTGPAPPTTKRFETAATDPVVLPEAQAGAIRKYAPAGDEKEKEEEATVPPPGLVPTGPQVSASISDEVVIDGPSTPVPREALLSAIKKYVAADVDRTEALTASHSFIDSTNRAPTSLASTVYAATASKQLRTTFKLTRMSSANTSNDRQGSKASTSSMWLSGDVDMHVHVSNGTQGQLDFETGRTVLNPNAASLDEARQARYLRLLCSSEPFHSMSVEEQIDRVALLREVVDFMRYSWQLRMPSVIFSVTGSAAEFSLRPKFRDVFVAALLNATRSTNAWIVSGGTDTGIMKMVGDALALFLI